MSLFGKQLETRLENDRKAVTSNEQLLGAALSGRRVSFVEAGASADSVAQQMKLIARYFRMEQPDIPTDGKDADAIIEEAVRATNMGRRGVRLTGEWWKDCEGPILAKMRDGDGALALFPGAISGLYYRDATTGKKVRVTKKNASVFAENAVCFYQPLPARPMTGGEYYLFLLRQIKPGDLVLYFIASALLSVGGIVATMAVKIAFDRIIPTGTIPLLISLFLFLVSLALANFFMRSARFSLNMRMQNRLDVAVGSSIISRVLNLPVSFFSENTAGGLSQKVVALNALSKTTTDIIFVITNTLVSIIMALPVMFVAPELLPAELGAIALVLVVYVVTTIQEQKLATRELSSAEKNGGVVFDLISGAQRLKLSGSEDRAYARWLRGYAEQAGTTYNTKFPLCARTQLVTICRLLGLLAAFYLAYEGRVSVASFAAFSTAYGMAMGCLDVMAPRFKWIAQLGPLLKQGEPILQAVPEYGEGKTMVSELTGRIELNHVTFRYEEDSPAVLDDLSLTIEPGEYVGVVGRSGCGKSSLVKVLLGFETPQEGTVCYDEHDTSTTNLRSLRRCIGTVLQDGKLFAGDIYSNITITSPTLSVEDAWDAAEKVGMAEDIRLMPMGMHTHISEGSGGISGGQKQRLMIARAIVGKPKILIMDEATSALDNLTQKKVTDSLDALDCTRIVIAHRLSTIRSCDRIIALDRGKIVESGSYDELMEKDGFFAELVKRQQIGED